MKRPDSMPERLGSETECCATCRFSAGDFLLEEFTWCFRRSPQVTSSSGVGWWPKIHYVDWCGEWEERKS